MKKLSLKLDDLQVESFSTADGKNAAGTVQGYVTNFSECGGAYCTSNCGDNTEYAPDGCSETVGMYCGDQGTMNPFNTNCVDATMAGNTCNGAVSCGPAGC